MLRSERERAGLTQREVADALDMAAPTWSQIEGGHRRLAERHVAPLAALLGLDDDATEALRAAAAKPAPTRAALSGQLERIERKLDRVLRYLGVDSAG